MMSELKSPTNELRDKTGDTERPSVSAGRPVRARRVSSSFTHAGFLLHHVSFRFHSTAFSSGQNRDRRSGPTPSGFCVLVDPVHWCSGSDGWGLQFWDLHSPHDHSVSQHSAQNMVTLSSAQTRLSPQGSSALCLHILTEIWTVAGTLEPSR